VYESSNNKKFDFNLILLEPDAGDLYFKLMNNLITWRADDPTSHPSYSCKIVQRLPEECE